MDIFVFDAVLDPANIDIVADFVRGVDRLHLDDAVFTRLITLGELGVDAFHVGPKAHDATDRIIYNGTTGAVMYDPDGTGASAAIKFAQLTAGTGLSYSDLFVI